MTSETSGFKSDQLRFLLAISGQAGVGLGATVGCGNSGVGTGEAIGIGKKTTGTSVLETAFQTSPLPIRSSLLQSAHGEGDGDGLNTRYATSESGLWELWELPGG
jgi:hypothetical protein